MFLTDETPDLVKINISPIAQTVVESLNKFPSTYTYVPSIFDVHAVRRQEKLLNYISSTYVKPKCILHLFDAFGCSKLLYTIVDIEKENDLKARQGYITKYTQIYIANEEIFPLKELSLALVRPFRKKKRKSEIKSIQKVIKSLINNKELNEESEDDDDGFNGDLSESNAVSRLEGSIISRKYSNSYIFNLLKFLENVLFTKSTTVFIQGREIYFPKPYCLSLGRNPWLNVPTEEMYLKFFVESTGDLLLGIALSDYTSISIELDNIGEFTEVHYSPIEDTLPTIYEINETPTYIRAYSMNNPFKLYSLNTRICYQGLEMKTMKTLPHLVGEVDLPDLYSIYWISCKHRVYTRSTKMHEINDIYTKLSYFLINRDPKILRSYITSSNYFSNSKHQCDWNLSVKDIINDWKMQRKHFLFMLKKRSSVYIYSRIGMLTNIVEQAPVALTIYDLLTPQITQRISRLPCRLQPFALLSAIDEILIEDLIRVIHPTMHEISDISVKELFLKQITQQYSTVHESDIVECPVCLDFIYRNQNVLVLPCNHVFHSKCVISWFTKSTKCPICRFKITALQ